MKCKLSDLCVYRKGKVDVATLSNATYISTENMTPNRGGVTLAASLPTVPQTQEYKTGDVLVSNIRPYFKKIWYARCDGGCSNDVLVFQAKNGTDRDFLYYVLADDAFFTYSMATSKGTKMPRGDKTAIMEYEVPQFDVDTQKRIAGVLKSIDAKIELNTAINNNLEQQAQALYSHIFVDERKEDWKLGLLSDLVAVRYGKDHKGLADGSYPVYGSGGIMRYVERPLYTGVSVLIPRKGTLNNVMYVDGAFWSVDTMFYTEMLRPNVAKYVFHFLKGVDLASLNAGSAVPSMTTNILNAMQLYIPDDETLQRFEAAVSPMYFAMQENERQGEKLSAIRDTLLPRLMSGELDISQVEF